MGRITPTRGMRQGDPLSPFLFILCTEALIILLNGSEVENQIMGLRVAWAIPQILHLLFSNDSLLFYKVEVGQCMEILNCLKSYGKSLGQRLNAARSSIFFW